ncbi:hypothetical protein LUZ61_016770 [Rhynchospora tenuis]|uniref:HTH myb-type domain-containing protein n=1 Tax=Rhynchospora tenuis TaxID=198213 RepID=A0AAD5Z661_9POAL|nr:hypothetical protein LUZ61_016770 [Rhynchospora tenuis]
MPYPCLYTQDKPPKGRAKRGKSASRRVLKAWSKLALSGMTWSVSRYGNKWATIARLLPGRTDNSIKNHWNSSLRRRRRLQQSQFSNLVPDLHIAESDCESPPKRQSSEDVSAMPEPETSLSLGPPGEMAGEKRWEGEVEKRDMVGFVDIVREMIAEEVRNYFDQFRSEEASQAEPLAVLPLAAVKPESVQERHD